MYKVNVITKQIGPTCGIYAFLNGIKSFYCLENLSSKKIHKIVFALLQKNKLLHESEDDENGECTHSKTIETNNSNQNVGKTFVGEFFEIDNYITFLKCNQEFIIDEIKGFCDEKINFEIKKISIDCIKNYDNSLFISSISPNNQKPKKKLCNLPRNENVLHWISYQSSDNAIFKVMDSRKSKVYTMDICEIINQHKQLNGSTFKWSCYVRRKCININPIDKFIKSRLKYKEDFFAKKMINDIDYQVGEVVMIEKVKL